MEERVLKFIHRQKREIKKLKKQRAALKEALREKEQELNALLSLYSDGVEHNSRLICILERVTAKSKKDFHNSKK